MVLKIYRKIKPNIKNRLDFVRNFSYLKFDLKLKFQFLTQDYEPKSGKEKEQLIKWETFLTNELLNKMNDDKENTSEFMINLNQEK